MVSNNAEKHDTNTFLKMKKIISIAALVCISVLSFAQNISPEEQLRLDPKKAYGNDYPYLFETTSLTKAPRGYKPFYISHYARHGSRYYWNDRLYTELDTLLRTAEKLGHLTPEGAIFYERFKEVQEELTIGVSELTIVGWEQHQKIARTMYNRFPGVFKGGGYVSAISSLSGRCVISMSAFCQELTQCNPEIEVREQSSRFTLDGVVPTDSNNPIKHDYPSVKPRYESNRSAFIGDTTLRSKVIQRFFTSTEGLPGNPRQIAGNLVSLYTSLPSIRHEGLMGNLITDEDIVANWETSNLGSYSWVFGDQYKMIPILEDMLDKAEDVISGKSDHKADLRFGHDSCIGPLTVLMGINGADLDPEDPYEVKNCYQNWETCKASNIQLVFYKGKKASDEILVKCLMNGYEATLPLPSDLYPYYRWSDFRDFFRDRCLRAGK